MPAESVYIFDACALIALLQSETGAERIEAVLQDQNSKCLIHAINLCEVAYDSIRRDQSVSISEWLDMVKGFGLEVYWSIDFNLLNRAAYLKAHWRRVSLADCFALALVEARKGKLLTSDHHELDPLVLAGVTAIEFFRDRAQCQG